MIARWDLAHLLLLWAMWCGMIAPGRLRPKRHLVEASPVDSRHVIQSLFNVQRALIGTVHLDALPGTPASSRTVGDIGAKAVGEARVYHDAGFDGILLENTHDRPYTKGDVGPEIVACMAAIGAEVRRATPLPMGIQILAGANMAAVAAAMACGASFVRVEGFVFAHVADEGLIESSAATLLRYRRAIGADHLRVFADVKKKHSAHAITADMDIVETAKAAEFFLVDGVIVSGISTGEPTDPQEVAAVSQNAGVATLVGSGITIENIDAYQLADALIVGSWIKQRGHWSNPIDPDRATALVAAFRAQ